jgi:asparagine synthase (glutamine-hydrolysing)
MCGVLDVVDKSGRGLDLSACRRALSAMNWRGPDKAVSTVRERVFLGQTILSLTGDIQGSAGEHLGSTSGRYTIAFNGEVYNFRALAEKHLSDLPQLRSAAATDSEVLANLHERLALDEVPRALDGMYAYTVLDETTQTLTLAGDPQGEKSLYVFENENLLIVCSEIRPILTLVPGISPDAQSLRDYFRTRHLLLLERTAHIGIRQLAPGALETFNLKTHSWSKHPRRRLSDWIDPQKMAACSARSLDDLTDELDALLSKTVKEMLPDGRGFAAVVSGGVDSSLIAHYALKHGQPKALVAVNHIGKDRISNDLLGFEKVLGGKIETLDVDAPAYGAEIPRAQAACGSPLPSHSFVAQALQSARVRERGARVLFGGEGGDEAFGGYSAYLNANNPDSLYSPSPYSGCFASKLKFAADSPERIENDLQAAWRQSLEAYSHVSEPSQRAALATMYCDTAYQLPPVCLRGADLMSMRWSVEARTVLVRRPILEFALNLPLSAKIDRQAAPLEQTKTLLKRLFLRVFPKELLVQKQGFAGFPNESGAYLGAFDDYLALDTLGIARTGFDAAKLDRDTLWKLINIEYFLRSRVPA